MDQERVDASDLNGCQSNTATFRCRNDLEIHGIRSKVINIKAAKSRAALLRLLWSNTVGRTSARRAACPVATPRSPLPISHCTEDCDLSVG